MDTSTSSNMVDTSIHTDEIIKIYCDLLDLRGNSNKVLMHLIHQYGICQKVYDYSGHVCYKCYTECDICCHEDFIRFFNVIDGKNVCDSEVCLETITINMQSKLAESLKQVTELSNALVKIKFTKKDDPKTTAI